MIHNNLERILKDFKKISLIGLGALVLAVSTSTINAQGEIKEAYDNSANTENLSKKQKNENSIESCYKENGYNVQDLYSLIEKIEEKEDFQKSKKLSSKNPRLNKYLRKDEYIVPQKVLNIFASLVDPNNFLGNEPGGGYININHCNSPDFKKSFEEKSRGVGFNEEEIKEYLKIFNGKKIILIGDDTEETKFLDYLIHERFHKEVKKLSKQDYGLLMSVAKKICFEEREDGSRVVKENYIYFPNYNRGFALSSACLNPEEFYAYLIGEVFHPETLEYFKKKYPEAHEIYKGIMDKIIKQISEK